MKRLILLFSIVFAPVFGRAWTCYVSTGGAATNSGSRNTPTAAWSGAAGYAVAASTNIIYLDGTPDLSTIDTAGADQDSIYIASATNTNQKIFAITGVDDVADTVTVREVVTGMAVSSFTWTIGGQHLLTSATVEASLRAGDFMEFQDNPAESASIVFTCRTSGDNTTGPITMRGKSGTRPILKHTSTSVCLSPNGQTYWRIENLEFQQTGASGYAIGSLYYYWELKNIKISDSASYLAGGLDSLIADSEFSGMSGSHVLVWAGGAGGAKIINNYIHDNAGIGIGINSTSINAIIDNNIIDTVTGQGIIFGGAPTAPMTPLVITRNTVYNCGNSGLEVADKDYGPVVLYNNIFKDNGDAATEYNFEQIGGTFSASGGVARNNIFNISGGRGGGNVYGYTLDATDLTTDPLFTDAANGDFSLQTASPAKAAGYPGAFLGGSTGYLDIGAVQRQEPAAGGWNIGHMQ